MADQKYERFNEAVLSRILLETKQSAAAAVERATELLAEREVEVERLTLALNQSETACGHLSADYGEARVEIERLVGELKHQRQRADDGADQFHWLAEWCRTQFTVDNNAVIGRDGWPRRLVEVVAKAVDVEIERLRGDRECLTRWFLARVVDGYHGCVSGDCPHLKEAECVAAILEHFDEEQAAKAAGGDDAS